ncbi:MAG: toll/interleukin-1 receptor domain-containing protein [Haliscomenobacteraceae bacterium CHB4]|nr:hypothetical protein [Saprospiraceae bacterium]MCE7924466.1 toll/interleukin-1 receptor domain-containing protein [Haliscomenobacteraceae bacterium CHB4]
MAYEYEVFISYRRTDEPPVQTFLERSFIGVFRGLLNEMLQPNGVRIFYDRHDIRTGKKWPGTIHKGLAHSKILVPILIPSYFHREWCLREYAVFYHREQQANMGDDGLIFPVLFTKVGDLPAHVTERIQLADFSEYNYGEIRKDSPENKPFRKAVERFAKDVFDGLSKTPAWNPDWANNRAAWCDTPYQNLLKNRLPPPVMNTPPSIENEKGILR